MLPCYRATCMDQQKQTVHKVIICSPLATCLRQPFTAFLPAVFVACLNGVGDVEARALGVADVQAATRALLIQQVTQLLIIDLKKLHARLILCLRTVKADLNVTLEWAPYRDRHQASYLQHKSESCAIFQ